MELIHKEETYKILGAAMEVHSILGSGFLEAVYQEALAIEFEKRKIPFTRESKLEINYKGQMLSKYYVADFVCFNKVIVETKATKELEGIDEAQVINYLKSTGLKVGLLINFGAESLEHRRLLRR
jgi:GxxExxY protein